MYSSREETILKLIMTGRDSLDHFVDTLQVTCSEAQGVVDGLIEKYAVKPKGSYFTDALSYTLTDKGSNYTHTLLHDRTSLAVEHNLLEEELSIIKLIDNPWTLRSELERKSTNIIDGGMQSILVHLHEERILNFKGVFVVKVLLTEKGKEIQYSA